MLFSELETICNGEVLQQSGDVILSELCIDTRNVSIQKGSVFFAIQGSNHDGHKYVEEAYNQGVRLFVVEKDVAELNEASVLKVASSIEALQRIASYHRSLFDYPVLGITGSNGKTIVKEWLSTLLGQAYQVVKSPKSYNSQVGVPLSVWQMSANDNLGIFEAGISKTGEMANLEKIIKPTIGIFTNIGEAHNQGFKSKVEKAEEKALLFKGCQKVIYSKSEKIVEDALLQYIGDKSKLIGWTVEHLEQNMLRISFDGHTVNLRLKFKEPYFIENAIHCAVVMKVLGLDENIIQSGLNNLPAVKMRLELKQAVGQSYLIDDTYNNDLHGMEVALDFLSRQNQKRTKSVIFSDISQTGIEGVALYKRVNQLFRKNQVSKVIGIGKEIEKYRSEIDVPSNYFPDTDSFLKSNHKLADEVVLVKGARNFAFERIVSQLEKNIHRTVLEINLENVVHNLNYYRSKLKPGTKIMAMVKAYAYGGGIFEIANLLQYHKIDYLGVAYIDEAVELRKHGIYVPIMIMNPTSDSFRLLKEYNLEPEIYSLDLLHEFISYFEDTDGIPSIHLKLESGMNRLGFTAKELTQVQQLIARNKQIKIRSVFSHLAGSESPLHDSYSESQVKHFIQMADQVCESLWYKPLRHIVNTGGISRFPQYHFDMVRLGVGLYGYDPTEQEQHQLKAVGTLKSNISQIKKIKRGETVGYGRKGLANKDMSIATIPIGYADGYLRAFGNGKGSMLVRGQLVFVFGNVCMDMTMLDVTNVDCKIGDEVIVFGEKPSVKELANQIGTIPYEIMTNIGQRVKRVFQSE
ncbi:bifunctional UDP-N-acetylmuramoyl-tripeptide:D-alanyl-D-alanine ligase/alanine racemase [Reichenbachiella sp. MALMAid0571]|uniref:bifunctional UDP-N-acetylmuramoyl-tripeptide:D-alanyl-D-alanine ligase/alanine racemase n=1 Tax=Reichenbachiella sp. MALMAid0571 TaxID=3143939 RepID=UPI0032DE597A